MSHVYSAEAEMIAETAQRIAEEKAKNIMREKSRVSAFSVIDVRPTDAENKTEAGCRGLLPAPLFLEHYEQVLPGSAARILELVEREQRHRHDHEHLIQESGAQDARTGLVLAFGFIFCIMGLCIGAVLGFMGRELAGGLIGVGGFVCVAALFGMISLRDSKIRSRSVSAEVVVTG